jgi:xanthine/CO dehydrogenase XdhC/CoxF family maturation factor
MTIMNHSGLSLGTFFRHSLDQGEALVLATVVQTVGSTYRKAGAQMLIAHDGRAAGLLSGGCLEADLMERARAVLDTGTPMLVEYDTRGSDDVLWGIGLGCEGAMTIVMQRLDRANDYQPYRFVDRCRQDHQPGRFALVASASPGLALGAAFWTGGPAAPSIVAAALDSPTAGTTTTLDVDGAKVLIVPVELPPRLLVLGAGPDAMPLVEIAGLMNWQITVRDHRPAYAVKDRFPRARRVVLESPAELPSDLCANHYDAAVVMSHHLLSDEAYLSALADSDVPYVGLLGPAPRRARLMSQIGAKAQALGTRLHGPVGLDIGARTPETIALAIVSEIQAVLAGRAGGSFSHTRGD